MGTAPLACVYLKQANLILMYPSVHLWEILMQTRIQQIRCGQSHTCMFMEMSFQAFKKEV